MNRSDARPQLFSASVPPSAGAGYLKIKCTGTISRDGSGVLAGMQKLHREVLVDGLGPFAKLAAK